MPATETLLTEYARNGSERAFRELVSAYLSFVYSTALRLVAGDSHLAEDVAQTVFIDLARKAPLLPASVRLGGWLHRHTCFVARKALRKERRRRARERQAMQLQTIADYTQENISQLAAILDEAINKLGKADREAIILRFFEQHDFRRLGETLGSSEDAARMRVTRALEKLRELLLRRGVAMSVAGLAYVLGTKSAEAVPAAVGARISQVALAQLQKGMGWLSLVKHACLTRLNLGLASSAALVAVLLVSLPGRKTSAGPLMSGPSSTPMEFAGLTAEEEEQPPTSVPTAPQRAPTPATVLVTQPTPPPEPPAPEPSPIVVPPRPRTATPVSPLNSPQPVSAATADVGAPIVPMFNVGPGQGFRVVRLLTPAPASPVTKATPAKSQPIPPPNHDIPISLPTKEPNGYQPVNSVAPILPPNFPSSRLNPRPRQRQP
jgi:RNA polymerase sigma factor (sigma-70 family)